MKAFSSQKQTLYFALILVRDWTHSRMMCSPVKYQNQEIDQLPLRGTACKSVGNRSVKMKLRTLVDRGLLKPVKHSSWAAPIVVVPKAKYNHNSVGICGDYKMTVNRV